MWAEVACYFENDTLINPLLINLVIYQFTIPLTNRSLGTHTNIFRYGWE